MLKGKRILAVVPARGGSKGVPLKNLRPVNGRPLVALTGDVIKMVPAIDRAVVSTDHQEIARVARESGIDVPFMRPEHLSGDRIADWDVLHHALTECERLDKTVYDIIVMLQPTSPLRKPEHVTGTINMLIHGGFDSVWSLSPTDSKAHPLKQLTVTDNKLDYYDRAGAKVIARQQLTPVYHRNGAAYAIARHCLLEQKTIKGKNTGAFIIEGPMVSIDTMFDFALVEWYLKQQDT